MTRNNTRPLLRLLRFMDAGACRVEAAGGARCRVLSGSGDSITVETALLAEAAAAGLVLRNGSGLRATAEARSFVRRHAAGADEAFLDQHRTIETRDAELPEGGRGQVRINAAESPLAQLSRLRDRSGVAWFDAGAIAAGERLARDFQFAALQPKITARYEPRLGGRPGSAAGAELKDSVVAARMRVSRAVEAMGPELAGVALDICCFEKGLETVERERQWPARSAKLMLKTALAQLRRHYDPPSAGARRDHRWGAEGYRPDIGTLMGEG